MAISIVDENKSHAEECEEKENELMIPAEDKPSSSDDSGRFFRRCEIVGSVALLAVALVVEFVAMPQRIRPIPVQTIGDLPEIGGIIQVRNLIFDEELVTETMGTVGLVIVGLLLPLCLQLAAATWCTTHRRSFDRHNTLVSYLVAVSLTFLVVDVLKLYCGCLRPHFYDVCMPDAAYEFCTNEDEKEIREARDSFPSGHAGLSLSGLGSLAIYLNHRFGAGSVSRDKANTRDHRVARLWSMLAIVPVLLALFMGTSRIHDNYHHPADVLGGFAIGGASAYFCHHVWFLE